MRIDPSVKTLAALAALAVALPFNVALVSIALVRLTILRLVGRQPSPAAARDARTVLISGGKMTKALQLARSFHRAGHRVVLVESHAYRLTGHRFSACVDRFLTVPEPGAADYADALSRIVDAEHVDVFVPVSSPAASLADSHAIPKLSGRCDVVHVGPDAIATLDDKYAFAQAALALGLRAPASFRITDPSEVERFDFSAHARQFILKSIGYDPIRRLDLTRLPCATLDETRAFVRSLPISHENPWIMQEFIPGQEYCTHGTFRNGELKLHCCCRSSAFQVNYEHVDKTQVEAWVRRFAAGLNITGQASFDFIEAEDDGELYAIECNPRTHSAITMFYDHPGVADAYLNVERQREPIRPLPSSRPTMWTYHELWQLIAGIGSPAAIRDRRLTIMRGKDAVFDWHDPLPFLMLHHWQIPLLLLRDLPARRGWLRIDFNIGKLVQLGGD